MICSEAYLSEVEKEPSAKGTYLHPEAYNVAKEEKVNYNQDKK